MGQTLSVWPSDGVQVNFFLGWGAPIEFDFDLREMVDDEAVDSLIRLFRLVSSVVSKDVIIRPRGAEQCPSGPAHRRHHRRHIDSPRS